MEWRPRVALTSVMVTVTVAGLLAAAAPRTMGFRVTLPAVASSRLYSSLQGQRQSRAAQIRPRKFRSSRWTSSSASLSMSAQDEQQGTAKAKTQSTLERGAGKAQGVGSKVQAVVEEPIELPRNENSPELLKIRHTTSHVMAMAVQSLYPDTQVTIGPWIDNGFYYDFFNPKEQFTDTHLKAIKKEMDKIIKRDLPLRREEVSREEARRRIEALGEPFKLELLDSIKSEPITIYHCGPHVETTRALPPKAIQLQSVAGAYWRGDEKREMLQRIYGTAWETPQQLKAYKTMLEQAKKRDHRVLGKKLDLFSLQEDAGGGLVFWHPRGSAIRQIIETFWKETHTERGYDLLYTPHVANVNLWKTSGHFDFYKEGMFDQMDVEDEEYQIKPMNCPFHCLIFKDTPRSYRDLPVRWAELGTVYRYERSGTLHGLMRVRGFTQDDAHVFCLPSQLQDEIVAVLDLTEEILSKFGFDKYDIMLSTQPEKSVGGDDIWSMATAALEGALEKKGWEYGVDEGGGAFYGPKIDIKIRDAIGRTWQCSTIQCDFNLPERFDLLYADSDGVSKRPVMIHRAIFGSVERFFGILLESTAGDFPLWLAPEQVRLLPVTDAAADYCHEMKAIMKKGGVRVTVDRGADRLAKQIRNAEVSRVPLMCVVGDKEVSERTLAVRSRKAGDLGSFEVEALVKQMGAAVAGTMEFHEAATMGEDAEGE